MTGARGGPSRRRTLIVTGLALAGLGGVWAWPVASRSSRALALVLLGVVAAGATRLLCVHRVLRFAPAGLLALPLLVLLLPGRDHDAALLAARYLDSLRTYEGVRYVWGGESRRGIDCSGLVRRALGDASLSEGLSTANPRLLRAAADLWWNDVSARALGEGHRGLTREVGAARSIRDLPPGLVVAGDLAVTADGVHVLAALGDGVWIEADPSLGRVVVLGPADDNPWLHVRVHVVRWRLLGAG